MRRLLQNLTFQALFDTDDRRKTMSAVKWTLIF